MSPDEHPRTVDDPTGGPPPSTAGGPPNSQVDTGAVPGSAGRGDSVVGAAKERLGDRPATGGGQRGPEGRGREEGRTGEGRGGEGRSGERRGGGKRRRGRAEELMVPDATFTSYYGHNIVKAAPWHSDIPAYLFLGGLAAGSSLLGAGADLSGRPALRRSARIGATGAISLSLLALVHDLGRPLRFINMLRVIKPTSPMSIGTWIVSAYAPGAILAGGAEVFRLLPVRLLALRYVPVRLAWVLTLLDLAARPAGLAAAAVAPGVAAYTAVLLTDTATPAWHDAHRELPFVFVSSAAAASGGFGLLTAPLSQSGPARRLAVAGAVAELAIEHRMEHSMGLSAETLHQGTPGKLMRASKILTAVGAAGAALFGGRSRVGAAVSGAALMAGSACTRFGVFEAGQASAHDPKYTVVPQRERVNRRRAEAAAAAHADRTNVETSSPTMEDAS